MRGSYPAEGENVAKVRRFYGRFPSNGAAAPAAWTEGGKGMGVPTHDATGTFGVTLNDPPGGVLLGWKVRFRCDAIANAMQTYEGTWDASANKFTFFTATAAAPTVLADPPAAHADREFAIELVFGQSENL